MLCLRQRNETISFVLLVKREEIQIPVSYVSRPLQGMDICYTPTEKMVQALIHTIRSLREIFRKHKVKVVTNGPMEEILKLSEREGWLAKWAVEKEPYASDEVFRIWKTFEELHVTLAHLEKKRTRLHTYTNITQDNVSQQLETTQRRNNFEEGLFKDRFPTEEELVYHKELLGEPQPPFSTLEPKIRRGNLWSLKIPCVIGTIYTGHAYIDLKSPVNIMSRAYYNKIREKPFQARRNPYQPYKFCNFVGKAKNMHIFIGCFIYVVDFMILEDLGSIIDSGLSEVVLGQPFAHTSKLTYDESLGLIRFAQRDDEVVFRMPQRAKELDRVSPLEKDKFEAFFMDSLKVRKMRFKHVLEKRKGYYKACMNLGRNYKRDRETIDKLKTNH
ncbi:protein kinase-like domain, concanavalin A-like lectin/glucanase domain protein, partial [Tanacetum coccineum]